MFLARWGAYGAPPDLLAGFKGGALLQGGQREEETGPGKGRRGR